MVEFICLAIGLAISSIVGYFAGKQGFFAAVMVVGLFIVAGITNPTQKDIENSFIASLNKAASRDSAYNTPLGKLAQSYILESIVIKRYNFLLFSVNEIYIDDNKQVTILGILGQKAGL